MLQPLSAIIFAKNHESRILNCLASVGQADEVLLVDMGGEDKTLEMAIKAGIRTVKRPAVVVEQVRQWAGTQAKYRWQLMLDADEEIPPTLMREILDYLKNPKAAAIALPRCNYIFGRQMQASGWWPDYQIRLVDRDAVVWSQRIHQPPKVVGSIGKFKAIEKLAIIHHHINSVDEYIDRIKLFTSQEQRIPNPKDGAAAVAKAFFGDFYRRLFVLKAYRDGDVGLYASMLQAVYEMVALLKAEERLGFVPRKLDLSQLLKQIEHDMRYWRATYAIQTATNPLKRWWWRWIRKINQ